MKKVLIIGSGIAGLSTAIALAENAEMLRAYDTAVETPTLQQLSVGILRKAEEDEK